MKENVINRALADVSDVLSLAQIAKIYFDRDKSWLYHKMQNDIINGTEYRFSADECEKLVAALLDISDKVHTSAFIIKTSVKDINRRQGRYFTRANVFQHPLFMQWLHDIPNLSLILEPFAGSCSIPQMVEGEYKWACYDLEPQKCDYKVTKRNTIKSFPKGYKVCITNPPYLAKNSATRRGLAFPTTRHDDLYKHCLQLILENCQYVAAIVPESFLQADLFHDRLFGIISIPDKVFEKTDCPVCLALFQPKPQQDFSIWIGNSKVGTFEELKRHNLSEYYKLYDVWQLNDPAGTVGVLCIDSKQKKISFLKGEDIASDIRVSSRSYTRISGLPKDIDLDTFLEKCNELLSRYRENTHDVFLTSFKGLHKDGSYRRRISFGSIKCIMNAGLHYFISCS